MGKEEKDLIDSLESIKEDYHDGFSITGCILAYKSNDDDDDKLYMIRKDEDEITYVTEIPEICNNYVSESMQKMGNVYDSLNNVVNSAKHLSVVCSIVRVDTTLEFWFGTIAYLSIIYAIYILIVNRTNYTLKNILAVVGLVILHIINKTISKHFKKQVKEYTDSATKEEVTEAIMNR